MTAGFIGWLLGGSWEIVRLLVVALGSAPLQLFVESSASFWIAAGVAGLAGNVFDARSGAIGDFAAVVVQSNRTAGNRSPASSHRIASNAVEPENIRFLQPRSLDDYRIPWAVWLCFAVYTVVFVAMNWQLYRALLLPHGDSAMYEEHLWNLLHGKGFRSYLDQGIFLGEHVQVIHLLLIPLYLLWPSQMLLELCDSVLLAACCIPVYWMARRHTSQTRAVVWLAAASLLYFPLQYLDIAIEFKTFRPNGLGIPVLLFALDQLERRRYKTLCLLAAVALSAQEDYAIVLAPLGVWIALALSKNSAKSTVESPAPPAVGDTSRTAVGRRSQLADVCLWGRAGRLFCRST